MEFNQRMKMKASEARSKSEDVLRTKHLLDTAEIRSAIDKAVMKGEFKAHVYQTLPVAVVDHFKVRRVQG